jgi:outer membrane immunogenic protein
MRRCLLTLFAAAAVGLAASQVTSAADLTRRAPPAPAYVPPAPLPYLWTGCYVGGNVGGAWSNFEITDVATGGTVSTSNSGFAGGGQIGFVALSIVVFSAPERISKMS